MFVYFWDRESVSRGGIEGEGDTESEAVSALQGVSTEPDVDLELMKRVIMTWAEVGHLTDGAIQVALFFMFWGTSILFSTVVAPIYIPTNSAQVFSFFHILTNTCYFSVFYFLFLFFW